MKALSLVVLLHIFGSSAASAAVFNPREQQDANTVLTNQTSTVWTCSTPDKQDAMSVILVKNFASSVRSSEYVLVIQDPKISDALGFRYYPLVLAADSLGYNIRATEGYNQPTVNFFSSSSGMKLVSVTNGLNPSLNNDRNWFFSFGKCIRN